METLMQMMEREADGYSWCYEVMDQYKDYYLLALRRGPGRPDLLDVITGARIIVHNPQGVDMAAAVVVAYSRDWQGPADCLPDMLADCHHDWTDGVQDNPVIVSVIANLAA